MSASRGSKTGPAGGGRTLFPPELICEVKALACQLPAELGIPVSRLSSRELQRHLVDRGLVAQISHCTIWRWLSQDAIRPWSRRSWVFPRDPDFAAKAGRVLDLYARRWGGKALRPGQFVLSADEKTGLQIRRRIHPLQPPRPRHPLRVEHEYKRLGTSAYLAAWDVHRARLFGHVADRATIETFDAFVAEVMGVEPYRSARRVFWIVDNGTIHRGQRSVERLEKQWANLKLVHLPVHASWLNQIEIYFSVLARKALTPDHFASRAQLVDRILGFQAHYETIAKPFDWKFTRKDLHRILANLDYLQTPQAAAA